jgi:cytochrome c553
MPLLPVALHRAVLCAAALFSTLPLQARPAVEDSIAQRVQACTGCHGKEGRAASDGYHPRIAGKPAGYLYQQLLGFRDGRRHYTLMTGLLEPLSDAYLQEIAAHFAALELPYPPPQPATVSAAVLARGEALVRRGNPARDLQACAQCHGKALMGVAPAVPGLLGLPRDYLTAQLGAWQSGARHARAPDCMAQVAQRLGADDASAVAQWLAAQPVPTGAKPQAAATAGVVTRPKPTLDCGSEPASASPSMRLDAGMGVAQKAGGDKGTGHRVVPATDRAAQVERGAYLARAGHCAGCHTARGGAPYAGGRGIDTPFGTVYASNLTPDALTGLGLWTPADFRRALHEGRSRDGRLLSPAFPYPNYSRVTPQDADALFAFLQSLPAVAQPQPPHALRFPFGSQAALAAWRALYFRPAVHRDDPARSADWNRGAYLVQGLGHCGACHGGRNALGASDGGLGGGIIPVQNWYAPALNDPRAAGVVGWPEAEVVALLKNGVTGGALPRASTLGPMAEVVRGSTQHLSDTDLRAMAVYLQGLPQGLAHKAAPVAPAAPASPIQPIKPGAALYERHCAACHGDRGEGVPGAYPPLAGNRAVVMQPAMNLVRVLLEGGFAPATAGHPRPYGMPPFATLLSNEEAAAVLTHVRSSWGNAAPAVSALDMHRWRGSR